MYSDEDTELKDLVAQTLETNGVLNKLRAELRASVFLALEEQDVMKNGSVVNHKLKKFLSSKDGCVIAGLVKDFLQCFNLDFTLTVFDPETNHGGKLLSREELVKDLNISPDSKDTPLLLEILKRNHQGNESQNGHQRYSSKHKNEDSPNSSPTAPRSPSRIPQRLDSKNSKSDTSLGSEKSEKSIDISAGRSKQVNGKTETASKSLKNTRDDDDDLFSEHGLNNKDKQRTTKIGGWIDTDLKSLQKGNGKASSSNGQKALGSLLDAPPLPGMGNRIANANHKDDVKSTDLKVDLAAIDQRISELGFEIPKDDYDYEDDFQASSSRKSEGELSITEEIEEDLAIGSFAGSKGDDGITTDHTVSDISTGGFDYGEDIEI